MSAAEAFPVPTHMSPKPGEPVWDLALNDVFAKCDEDEKPDAAE